MEFKSIEEANEKYIELKDKLTEKENLLTSLTKEKEEKETKIKELQELNQKLFIRVTSEDTKVEDKKTENFERLNFNIKEWK